MRGRRGKPFFQEKEGFPPDPHPKKAALLRICLFPACTASCFAACFRVLSGGAAAKKMTPSQESRFVQDLSLSCVQRFLLCRMFPGFSMRRSRKENGPSQESRFAQDLSLSCVYRLLLRRMFLSSIRRCSREKRRLFLLLSRI